MQFHTHPVFSARLGPIYLIGVPLVLVFGAAEAHAQWATVRGRVTDQADDQPLPGATLVLLDQDDGARLGVAADGNGYFVLSRILPGTYVLEASFVGYLPQSDTLVLAFDDRRSLDVRLQADEAEMDEVVVESIDGLASGRETVLGCRAVHGHGRARRAARVVRKEPVRRRVGRAPLVVGWVVV